MNIRRRLIAVILLSCIGLAASPSTAQAGPLLDWLFQKNRSQGVYGNTAGYGAPGYGQNNSGYGNSAYGNSPGYGNTAGYRGPAYGYNAGYGNTYGTTARYGAGNAPRKSCLFGNCLFGGNRGLAANRANSSNQLAQSNPAGAAANPAAAAYGATTAGYAPQGSCGRGWCQQTVERLVPQIAYRTVTQPVPVTTYKTSTTINPANGLPRTCTRPCTSYSYQARRVPYTTYRRVYTTVPVADTLGDAPPTGFGQQAPQPNYALQPTTPGSCSSCQNGPTGNGYGYGAGGYGAGGYGASGGPGYTPGNAPSLPPAPQIGPWSSTPMVPPSGLGYGDPRGGAGAGDWRPVPSQGSDGWQALPQQQTPAYEAAPGGGPAGATDWRAVPPNGSRTTPPAGYDFDSGVPADRPPSLRPDYDAYGSIDPQSSRFSFDDQPSTELMKPLPMSDTIRRRISRSSNFRPKEKSDTDADQTHRTFDRANQDFADSQRARTPQFSTPNQQRLQYGSRPRLEAPSNFDETRLHDVDPPGVLDLERGPRDNNLEMRPNPLDKTAQRPLDVEPASRTSQSSRYTSVPIDWSQSARPRNNQRISNETSNRPTRRWIRADESVWTAAR